MCGGGSYFALFFDACPVTLTSTGRNFKGWSMALPNGCSICNVLLVFVSSACGLALIFSLCWSSVSPGRVPVKEYSGYASATGRSLHGANATAGGQLRQNSARMRASWASRGSGLPPVTASHFDTTKRKECNDGVQPKRVFKRSDQDVRAGCASSADSA
jgi:hypothetical protein